MGQFELQHTPGYTMEFLVLATCLSVSAAHPLLQLVGLPSQYGYGAIPLAAAAPLNLVGHANGAIVPAEGAAIVAARANHLAAHSASTVEGVAAAISAAHGPQLALNNLNLVGHANGAIVPLKEQLSLLLVQITWPPTQRPPWRVSLLLSRPPMPTSMLSRDSLPSSRPSPSTRD